MIGFFGVFVLYCVMNFLTIPITEKSMAERRKNIWETYLKCTNKFLIFRCGLPEKEGEYLLNEENREV